MGPLWRAGYDCYTASRGRTSFPEDGAHEQEGTATLGREWLEARASHPVAGSRWWEGVES